MEDIIIGRTEGRFAVRSVIRQNENGWHVIVGQTILMDGAVICDLDENEQQDLQTCLADASRQTFLMTEMTDRYQAYRDEILAKRKVQGL